MATFREQFAQAAAVAMFALAAGSACGTGSSESGHACDAVCAGVPNCGQTTCLSQCVTVEAECTVAGLTSAFQAWSSCMPNFACVGGQYQATNCARESTAAMACGAGMTGTAGPDAGKTDSDSSADASRDGSAASDDGSGSADSETVRDTGVGIDTGPELEAAMPDTSIADANSRDTSVLDTGPPDTSPRDTGTDTSVNCLQNPPVSCDTCAENTIDPSGCQILINCYKVNACNPADACGASDGVCGVNTLDVTSGVEPAAAKEIYSCDCP